MKEPKSKLPWKRGQSDNILNDELNNTVIRAEFSYELVYDDKDINYMLQACNNFPKAIELLTELDKHEGTREEYFKLMDDISKFLKELKEGL